MSLLWNFLSWIANCQLVLNDVNILGASWAVLVTFLVYKRLNKFQKAGFSILGLKKTDSRSAIIIFLLSVTLVVWIQNIVDLGLITPVALVFGRWIEMEPLVGSLSIWSFLVVFWNVIATIVILSNFYWQKRVYKLFHFTKESFFLIIAMLIFYAIVTKTFGIWNYNLLKDPTRTIFFWVLYPEIRILWALLFLSIIKKPNLTYIHNPLSVKNYYILGEKYDWVTDPKGLEKIFHSFREKHTMKFINKYSSNSTILDVGCGTGLITRKLRGDVLGLDINDWNIKHAKANAPNAKFTLGDCENMKEIPSSSIDMVVFTETLEHLVRPEKALKEIKRVLKVKGKAIITVPSNLFVWKFRRYLTTTHPHNEPFHRNFSKTNFKSMLKDFKILQVSHIVFGLTLLAVVEKNE